MGVRGVQVDLVNQPSLPLPIGEIPENHGARGIGQGWHSSVEGIAELSKKS
jgi:hypothetical protein